MKTMPFVGVLAVASVVVGCKTKEMKSTPFYEGDAAERAEEASERVNLWPVAYWRNPVGSVAWPFVSFSDDHLAFRPIYSQYRQSGKNGAWDEFNIVWPFVQADTRGETFRLFPVYWNGPDYNALFPLWYYGRTANSWSFNTLAGLAGARRTRIGYRCSWAFPLWYEDNAGLFSTLLYGQTKDSHWVFPLWYKGEKAFVSPFYAQGGDGDKSWWSVPPALSWGMTTTGAKTHRSAGKVLLGFGGWDNVATTNCCERRCWWASPFVHRKTTLPAKPGGEPTVETLAAACLSGWKTDGERLTSLYAFPLFSWQDNGSWLTPLGGQINSSGTTNTYITPLVRVTTGKQTGGGVVPVWSQGKDVDFDDKLAIIDSASLPDSIKVSVVTNTCKNGKDCGKTHLTGSRFNSADDVCVLLQDFRHSVRGSCCGCFGSATNSYQIVERCKRGNVLLQNYSAERIVSFDMKTKAKLSDVEKSDASLFLLLYLHDWNRDRMKGEESTSHRVLWRLWRWEERNGDVAIDAFPGFTYDERRDGYSKTSFLWRLFRNEYDPKTGRKVDVLFIPVWR